MNGLPESVFKLSNIFAANGYKLYLVGGYVRNMVLSLSGGDFDVCSRALPEAAALFLRAEGFTVIEKAPELGTIEVHITQGGKKYVFEHTTFRRDFYPPGGEHRPKSVEFTSDMREDAARRDFTVNALYLDLETGETVDPTGRGLEDAKQRVIRAAAEDPDITIRDDGLRIMRMARFAAELGFSVSEDLMMAAKARAGLLADISAERKRDELKRILLADVKYEALKYEDAPEKGLQILREAGAIPFILPRLWEGNGVAQSEKYHKYDVLGHGMHACACAPAVLELRLAALLHDIGKPAALRTGGNMYRHEIIGETLAAEELERLRFENSIKAVVPPLVRNHMFDLEGRAKPKAIRRRAIMLGKRLFPLLIELRRADFWGSGLHEGPVKSADSWQKEYERMIETNVPWSVKELNISGGDIMELLNIPPSPAVGKILDMLWRECVARPEYNTPQKLKSLALKHSDLLP
ncbi:MAG: CCA tRNA nucleotidyltransferase [Burkholderiales bacterium]